MNQLAEGLQNDFFNNPNANAGGFEDDEVEEIEPQRRPRRQIIDS